jgi:hypothetical protein
MENTVPDPLGSTFRPNTAREYQVDFEVVILSKHFWLPNFDCDLTCVTHNTCSFALFSRSLSKSLTFFLLPELFCS